MPKPIIHATTSQLKGAFRQHYKIAQRDIDNRSNQLLLFYAVECGLKYLYLISKNYHSTSDFARNFSESNPYGHQHDIVKWVSELNLNIGVATFRANDSDPIKNVHEKLRYGLVPANHHIQYLQSLASYLKQEI